MLKRRGSVPHLVQQNIWPMVDIKSRDFLVPLVFNFSFSHTKCMYYMPTGIFFGVLDKTNGPRRKRNRTQRTQHWLQIWKTKTESWVLWKCLEETMPKSGFRYRGKWPLIWYIFNDQQQQGVDCSDLQNIEQANFCVLRQQLRLVNPHFCQE